MRHSVKAPQEYKDKEEMLKNIFMKKIVNSSPQEIEAWIETDVNSMKDVKELLKVLAKAVALSVKKL